MLGDHSINAIELTFFLFSAIKKKQKITAVKPRLKSKPPTRSKAAHPSDLLTVHSVF
jgi:hypothetical protein